METKLDKFMENITIINKEISTYEDEKGNALEINTIQLMPRCVSLELDKNEYIVKKYEGVIEDLDYNIVEITRQQSKYNRTKKEEDRYTIEDAKVSVRQVWNVSNGAGAYKSFTNKEEALDFRNKIRNKVITYFE